LTLVEFFHTECPHCQQQTEPLKEIYSNYSSEIDMFSIGGYKLGSNKVDSKNDLQQFKFQYTLNWPHLYDANGELMRDYGFNSYPSMVLIKDGEIVYSHSGKLTYDQLSAQIEKYK
jgi:thiol-disulfide isomerase/thioredoxin